MPKSKIGTQIFNLAVTIVYYLSAIFGIFFNNPNSMHLFKFMTWVLFVGCAALYIDSNERYGTRIPTWAMIFDVVLVLALAYHGNFWYAVMILATCLFDYESRRKLDDTGTD